MMADGTKEEIELVVVGDGVLATDTETGSTAAREVESVTAGTGDRTLVEVVTTDGGVVVATDGHPIWEVCGQAWMEAVDLEPGDLLLGVDGELVEVADVVVAEEWTTVHNLTVDGDHTYSVVAGDDTILTHNCGEQLRLFDPDAPQTASVVRHGPLNPGPLADDVANTFRSGTCNAVRSAEPTTLYRVYSDPARQLGPYWTPTRPSGPTQSIIDSALDPAWGTQAWVQIRVPGGTTFFEGAAAAQRGLVGGGNQVFLPWVDDAWVVRSGGF